MLNLIHKKPEVYRLCIDLVKDVYSITNKFPADEKYILVAQIKRAAISVISNLAEGSARISKNEKKRFYEVSRSSLVEVDTQIEVSKELNFISENELVNLVPLIESIYKILSKLISNQVKE